MAKGGYEGSDPSRWEAIRQRYEQELRQPGKHAVLLDLARRSRRGVVTLVFAAKDETRNNAVVLRYLIESIGEKARPDDFSSEA